MSVIRHGEIIEVVYDAERIVVHAPACASHGHAACDCEPMVFVPTEQLQGAVAALREVAQIVDDNPDSPVMQSVGAIVDPILDRPGGQ